MPEHGLIAGAQHLQETESDLCITFAEDYLKTQGLLVLAAVTIVAINAGMRGFMRWLATFERHHSVSAEQASMTLKVFLALFMNTGLVTLLVRGRWRSRAAAAGSPCACACAGVPRGLPGRADESASLSAAQVNANIPDIALDLQGVGLFAVRFHRTLMAAVHRGFHIADSALVCACAG